MANYGTSNQPNMYQPNYVDMRRLYQDNKKNFVETKLRENFPENFVKITIFLWILMGLAGIVLQISCITNGNYSSNDLGGIWAGVTCFIIASTIFDFRRRKTYQSYLITTIVVGIGGSIVFIGFTALNITTYAHNKL